MTIIKTQTVGFITISLTVAINNGVINYSVVSKKVDSDCPSIPFVTTDLAEANHKYAVSLTSIFRLVNRKTFFMVKPEVYKKAGNFVVTNYAKELANLIKGKEGYVLDSNLYIELILNCRAAVLDFRNESKYYQDEVVLNAEARVFYLSMLVKVAKKNGDIAKDAVIMFV